MNGYAYLIGDCPVNSSFRSMVRHIRLTSGVKESPRAYRRAAYRGAWNALQHSLRDYARMAGLPVPEKNIFPHGVCTGNPCTKCGAWYSALKDDDRSCFGDNTEAKE